MRNLNKDKLKHQTLANPGLAKKRANQGFKSGTLEKSKGAKLLRKIEIWAGTVLLI